MVIASEHAEGECQCPRIRMKERLLFDRVDLQGGNVAARHFENAVFVVADLADALEPVENLAAMAAGIAADRFILQLVIELRRAFSRALGENLAEGDLSFGQLRHVSKNAQRRPRIATQRSIRQARAATA